MKTRNKDGFRSLVSVCLALPGLWGDELGRVRAAPPQVLLPGNPEREPVVRVRPSGSEGRVLQLLPGSSGLPDTSLQTPLPIPLPHL